MDRLTRHDLKTDKFAREVGHTFEFLTRHGKEVKLYGLIALAVLLLGGGYYFYARNQASARQQALAQALRIDDAVVGTTPQAPNLIFATQQEKDAARTKAFTDLSAKYHGTQEGAIAAIYVASAQADKGNLAEAQKIYKDVMDSAPATFASVAQLSLAELYAVEGKTDEAEKLLRALINRPTVLVSKEQATLELGQMLAKTKPEEARKLLEPLRIGRTAVSRAAITALGTLPQPGQSQPN